LPEWIRVSVGTMPQNKVFIAALRELASQGGLVGGTLVKAG
jgi:histidinol-phosphate/aromatic aminotransferase/cobyric acid decarboxylase-like protein